MHHEANCHSGYIIIYCLESTVLSPITGLKHVPGLMSLNEDTAAYRRYNKRS